METHPEEFFTPKALGHGKWDPFMPGSSMFRHFTKLEQYLIRRKYCKARDKVYRQEAYDGILEALVFKEEKPETVTYTWSNPTSAVNISATGTINANGLTLGSETLDAETIKVMKEHIKAIRKEQMRTVKMGGK